MKTPGSKYAHGGISYPIRSSASPTWNRNGACARQVGTRGLGRFGQVTSSIPNGLPSINAGNDSPGFAMSCSADPTSSTLTNVRSPSPALPVFWSPVYPGRSPNSPAAKAALNALFSTGTYRGWRSNRMEPTGSLCARGACADTVRANASPVA